MRKLGPSSTKWLKILHIIFVALWFGGIISLLTLRLGLNLSVFDQVNVTYNNMKIIDDYLIRNGAQGILITSVVYGFCTNWGFFKHKWIAVKLVVFISQMIFGIFFLNSWMGANIAMLNTEKVMALNNPAFIHNNSLIQLGIVSQLILIIFLICISVLKPWKKKMHSSQTP
jgi:uncharacterized membrane protein